MSPPPTPLLIRKLFLSVSYTFLSTFMSCLLDMFIIKHEERNYFFMIWKGVCWIFEARIFEVDEDENDVIRCFEWFLGSDNNLMDSRCFSFKCFWAFFWESCVWISSFTKFYKMIFFYVKKSFFSFFLYLETHLVWRFVLIHAFHWKFTPKFYLIQSSTTHENSMENSHIYLTFEKG